METVLLPHDISGDGEQELDLVKPSPIGRMKIGSCQISYYPGNGEIRDFDR